MGCENKQPDEYSYCGDQDVTEDGLNAHLLWLWVGLGGLGLASVAYSLYATLVK